MQLSNKIESRRVDELTDHPLNEVYNSPLSEHERSMLYKSIMENGVQEPLWVTPSGMIVAGHERRRAARDLGLETVPTRTLENATEAEVLYYLVDNNVSRRGDEKDLMKKAKQAKVLYEHWGIRAGRAKKSDDERTTANDVAELLGEAPRTVRRWIRLLDLIPEFQLLVSGGNLGLIAGNHLAGLNQDFQKQIYDLLSSRGIEKIELNEVKAICKELEYREDRALEEEEDLREDNTDPDASSSSHAEGEGDAQHWHTPLEESQPAKAIDVVSNLFPDKGDNLKQRHFLMEIEKAERDVQRFKEKLVPLFDQAVKNESAKEMLKRINENLQSLVDQLQEVI